MSPSRRCHLLDDLWFSESGAIWATGGEWADLRDAGLVQFLGGMRGMLTRAGELARDLPK